MGHASSYICGECDFRAEFVSGDFDFGFSGVIVTPVVCARHGVVSADTGLNAQDGDRVDDATRAARFPCPDCNRPCEQWDRLTCPRCSHQSMREDLSGPQILWD
ncbi:hypothetical protein [Gordonia aichiensis]